MRWDKISLDFARLVTVNLRVWIAFNTFACQIRRWKKQFPQCRSKDNFWWHVAWFPLVVLLCMRESAEIVLLFRIVQDDVLRFIYNLSCILYMSRIDLLEYKFFENSCYFCVFQQPWPDHVAVRHTFEPATFNDGSDDEDTLPSLKRPHLCCPPKMTVQHLCKVLICPSSEQDFMLDLASWYVTFGSTMLSKNQLNFRLISGEVVVMRFLYRTDPVFRCDGRANSVPCKQIVSSTGSGLRDSCGEQDWTSFNPKTPSKIKQAVERKGVGFQRR